MKVFGGFGIHIETVTGRTADGLIARLRKFGFAAGWTNTL
jgi:hypothetical protein